MRIDHVLDGIAEKKDRIEEELQSLLQQADHAREEVQKPFIHESELRQKRERLNELNALLNVDKKENELIDGDVEVKDETKNKMPKDKEER